MRRLRQQLPQPEAEKLLNQGTNGVLSLVDIDGQPYGVPISYACDNAGHIYFHSAVAGRKLDCIRHEARCSFCVVGQDVIMPQEFTTYFRSVIVEGRISIVSEPEEIMKGLLLLAGKYSPGIDPGAEIAGSLKRVAVMRLDIESLMGKESIELVNKR